MDSILGKFLDLGLHPVDLVALSGGHTVGRTKLCDFVRDVHKPTCRPFQVLDVITPDVFDNKYFAGLVNRQGVFNSDQNLLTHPRTAQFVTNFANNQQAFFEQWIKSMGKLSGRKASNGEIRGDTCNRVKNKADSLVEDIIIQQVVASA
jgi:peroxidase